jgi:hypothetical protein
MQRKVFFHKATLQADFFSITKNVGLRLLYCISGVLYLPAVFFFNILLGIRFGTVAQHLKNIQQGGIKL